MKYISSDTNIWLDFNTIECIELPFRLQCKYVMFREALDAEIVDPPNLPDILVELGLEAVEITTEEFFEAARCMNEYPKISTYDSTALAIAKKRNIPLLTGDNALRKAAQAEKVDVMGTIGMIDLLLNEGCITVAEYRHCLNELLAHPERRLPANEINARLNNIKE